MVAAEVGEAMEGKLAIEDEGSWDRVARSTAEEGLRPRV